MRKFLLAGAALICTLSLFAQSQTAPVVNKDSLELLGDFRSIMADRANDFKQYRSTLLSAESANVDIYNALAYLHAGFASVKNFKAEHLQMYAIRYDLSKKFESMYAAKVLPVVIAELNALAAAGTFTPEKTKGSDGVTNVFQLLDKNKNPVLQVMLNKSSLTLLFSSYAE